MMQEPSPKALKIDLRTVLSEAAHEASDPVTDAVVIAASAVLIGSFFWVPAGLVWVYKRYCTTRRRKLIFLAVLVALTAIPLPQYRAIRRSECYISHIACRSKVLASPHSMSLIYK
jgi:hypothetical protein